MAKKLTPEKLRKILQEAEEAGRKAGLARKAERDREPHQFAVIETDLAETYQKLVGTMPEACGMAFCLIPKRQLSLRSKAAKQMVTEGLLSDWDYHRALCVRLPVLDQGISVREATVQGALEVLKKHGYEAYMDSRLD